jgi:hypothetical protein
MMTYMNHTPFGKRARPLALALVAVSWWLTACGDDDVNGNDNNASPGPDAGQDGGQDGGLDGGPDAGPDGGQSDNEFTNAANWSAFDASNTGGLSTRGYFGGVFDGRYVYYVPCRTAAGFHGVTLRYDTQSDFQSAAGWESYDAGATDGLDTRGYAGAVFDGRYVYYVPFTDESARHGRVLRYDTQGFFATATSWSAYDAGFTGGMTTVGYDGAAFDGRYVYFVPFGYEPVAHGRVLRYDTQGDFQTITSWSAFDAGATDGLVTTGYVGAEFDNRYVYFVPYSGENNVYHGRALRYDTQGDFHTSSSWTGFDAGNIDGLNTKGYKYAAFDGQYVYYVPYSNPTTFHGIALRYDTAGTN